mgnify:CR=1 FL=1
MRANEFLLENADIQYAIQSPREIGPETLDALADLIAAGSEVDGSMVLRNLNAAQSIAYATDQGQPVGIIVLKNIL